MKAAALVSACLFLMFVATVPFARAQVLLGGQMYAPMDVQSFSNKAFSVIISNDGSLKKGNPLAGQIGSGVAYSMDTEELTVRATHVEYPILAIVNQQVVWPAILEAQTAIDAGKDIHLSGYIIQTSRALKAGDHVLVLVIGGDSVLSVSKGKPWFTAFKEAAGTKARADAIGAWAAWRFHPDL